MSIEKAFFRQVMGHFVTGVTVATTRSQGTLAGLTVNAFCSVSLNPPLVLMCVDLNSYTLALFRESKIFAINILSDKQEHLSQCFSTSSQDRLEHFCHATYRTVATGAPVLDNTLAFVDARIIAEYPGGDHVIFLGQIEAMGTASRTVFTDQEAPEDGVTQGQNNHRPAEEQKPLTYYKGQYRHLCDHYHQPSRPTTTQPNDPLKQQLR